MARPRKTQQQRRTERFGNPRYSVEEKQHASLLASTLGLDPADYVRRRVLDLPVPYARVRANALLLSDLNRLGLELRAIGNNVNQLARDANSGRSSRVAWTTIYDILQQRISDVDVMLTRLALELDPEQHP